MGTELVYQSQGNGCGYACVKMALIHSSKRRDFAFAPERPIAGQAPSLADLSAYAANLGLKLSGYKVWDPRAVLIHRSYYPFIAIIKEDGLLHAVYVVKRQRGGFKVLDPAKGVRKMGEAEFLSVFDGRILIEEGYEEIAPRFRRAKPVGALARIAGSLISILPSSLLLAGLLVLSFAPSFGYAAIGLFLASLLAVMGGRAYLLSSLRRFDDSYIRYASCSDPKRRKEKFAHYQRYKGAAFACLPALLSSLFELCFAAIFLSFGDPHLGLSIGAMILLLCLKQLAVNPNIKRKEKEVERLEEIYLASNADSAEALASLRRGADSYSRLVLAEKAFGPLLALCLSCLCLLSSDFSPERFLFAAMSLLLISSCLDRCFAASEGLRKVKEEENYFALNFYWPSREDRESGQ